MPAYSFHIFQSLDVGYFSPLKRTYGREIDYFVKVYIIHIIKDEFFIAFHAVFDISFIEKNIQTGFSVFRLYLLSLQVIIFKMDIKLKTSLFLSTLIKLLTT
jgi:hypothetical protein